MRKEALYKLLDANPPFITTCGAWVLSRTNQRDAQPGQADPAVGARDKRQCREHTWPGHRHNKACCATNRERRAKAQDTKAQAGTFHCNLPVVSADHSA